MGFDNECILNIPSLPGEYFCPVCRTLIYPNEALQAQCTHLYCKPCLTYVVATTQACPYDGYLVTEADSKPLMESNKSLAETIGKVTVHCLYHKSGCQWQGQLSDCIIHGTACAYGNSPVVCNRCGTQIVHCQVQEHAQLCPGQTQSQQADSSLTQSLVATTQAVTPYLAAVTPAAPAVAVTAPPASTVPSAVTTSSAGATTASMMAVAPSFVAAPIATSQVQAVAPQTPTVEQYQQQLHYQQYYQQHYPGYNPYMQQYQQYGQYQQYMEPQMQVAPQNTAQAPAQSAPYVQPQVLQPSQPQHMVPSQSQSQNQSRLPQPQPQVVQQQPWHNPPLQSASQIPQMQPQSQVPLQLPHPQAHPTAHPPAPSQVGSQPFAMPATQATPSQVQPHVQPHPPEYQQVLSQQQHPQLQHLPQQQHLQLHIQLNSQIQHQHPQVQQQACPQPQAYHQPHPMPHAQPQNPPVHAVTSHQSYPQPQPAHQMLQSAPLQHPIHVSHQQVVGSQHRALVRPPEGQYPLQCQQSTMTPQGTQSTPQHQQHVGHHAQRPPIHPSIPSQAPQEGFPLNTSDCADTSAKGKGNDEFVGRESNSHGPDVQGHKESTASDASNDLEKGGSLQQVSQQNLGAPGSSSMGPQNPSGPYMMLPHHMLHPGSMPHVQGQPNQMGPPKHSFPENIRPPMQQQPYGSYHSEMAPRAPVPNQNRTPIPQPATIRPTDGMVRPPMGGPLPGQHDTTVPPFASKYVAQPHPLGMAKSNGVGVGPLGSSRAFHEGGLSSSREHLRQFAAYPGRHNANLKDIEENTKEFSGPTHLEVEGPQRGPRPFEGGLVRPEGFADSLPGRPPFPNEPGSYPIGFFEEFARKPHSTVGHPDFVSPGAEFGYHRIDGMPTLRNKGGHGGLREDQLGSGNLPGNVQHDFRSPEFPHARFHPGDSFVPRNLHGGGPLGHGQLHGIEPSGYHYQGHMHPDDHFTIDYSRHGFQKESGHFGLGGHLRNGDAGWCRICKFNCGSVENLDLHVHTREHQQCAMDIVLKMKHDILKNQKMNSGGPRSFNKKVAGKGNVRGNRR